MEFIRTTEEESRHQDLETLTIKTLLAKINAEDKGVPDAVECALPQIEAAVKKIVAQMKSGGRLFYMGAGTSGRLGILDASECPPTFGVPQDWVIGLIAGGDQAIRNAVEFAEDSKTQAWKDLEQHGASAQDFVIGIAASGTTPYVLGALEACSEHNIPTGCIVCNASSPIALAADFPIEVVVGPEFVTGSSRMKAGTAQKLVLNMISTTSMIQLGRVKGNRMVDMQLSNTKLVARGERMLMDELNINQEQAAQLLNEHKSVRNALKAYENHGNR